MRLALALLLLSSCSRGLKPVAPASGCTPGSTQSCACKSGATSTQSCETTGTTYSLCACERQIAYAIPPPATVRAGKPFSLHIIVTDSLGQVRVEEDARVTAKLVGEGVLQGEVIARFDEGEAFFTGLSVETLQPSAVIQVTSRGQVLASEPFEVTAGAAAKLAWGGLFDLRNVAGATLTGVPALQVQDQFGNLTAPTTPIAVTLSTTDPAVTVLPATIVIEEATRTLPIILSEGSAATRIIATAGTLQSAVSNEIAVTLVDPEWATTRIPDSSTAFCGNLVQHIVSDCSMSNPTAGSQDSARLSPAPDLQSVSGLFRDGITGLLWEPESPSLQVPNHAAAVARCETLTSAGLSWRLPTRTELISLLDLGAVNPPNEAYYSATPSLESPGTFWIINKTGNLSFGTVSYLRARCVSGPRPIVDAAPGAPLGQYESTTFGADTLRDVRTRLEWQLGESGALGVSGATGRWADALTYCDDLTLGGLDDWRLPSFKEINSLVDVRRFDPVIDLSVIPSAQSAQHWWTSTPLRLWVPPPLDVENGVWVLNVRNGQFQSVAADDGSHSFGPITIPEPHARCVRDF